MEKLRNIESIILEREVRGLRIATYLRLFIFVTLFIANFFLLYENTLYGEIAKFVTQIIVLTGILISSYFIKELNKLKSLNVVGLVGCIFDCFVIISLPYIWYNSVGGSKEGIPLTFILKSDLDRIIYSFLILNALSLRIIYPLIITIVSFFYKIGQFAYAYPELKALNSFATSYVEVNLGDKIMLDAFYTNLFLFLSSGMGLVYLTWIVKKTIYEASLAEKENSQISRYFSPAIAEKIKSASSEFMKPGGNLQEVGIMFSDIRNFTSISEKLKPEETMRMLSGYHEKMVKIIFENGGTLDKFIGDGIMATFGTPNSGNFDAENTLRAALGMRKALFEFNQARKVIGLEPISAGIGIHFGNVIAGNIGTTERLEYTVIGDNVNIASRIESACKDLQVDILCSRELLEKVPLEFKTSLSLKSSGEILLKGKSIKIEVFTVIE